MWFADRSLEDPICLRMCQCSAGWLFQNTYPDSTFSYPGRQKRGQQIIVICCCDRWLKYQRSCMWTNIPTTATAIPRSSSLSQHWLFVWNIFYCSIYSIRNNNPNWLIFFRRVGIPPTRFCLWIQGVNRSWRSWKPNWRRAEQLIGICWARRTHGHDLIYIAIYIKYEYII